MSAVTEAPSASQKAVEAWAKEMLAEAVERPENGLTDSEVLEGLCRDSGALIVNVGMAIPDLAQADDDKLAQETAIAVENIVRYLARGRKVLKEARA